MNFTVYKHTSPSNKVYIGITSQSVIKRWGSGHGYRHNEYFFRAIKNMAGKILSMKYFLLGSLRNKQNRKK